MIRNLISPGLALLVAGCANTQETATTYPKAIPVAWAQQPGEKGGLSVGRVVAIERRYGYDVSHSTHQGPHPRDTLIPVVITAGLLAGPLIMALSAVGADPLELREPVAGGGNVFRHSIQLNGTDTIVVWDEFWTYRIGDCVALRSKPEMLVPALADACE